MDKYRIRAVITGYVYSVTNLIRSEDPNLPVIKYIVEIKRGWWIFSWWIQLSKEILHLNDEFYNYDNALNYIKSLNGKLLYIC